MISPEILARIAALSCRRPFAVLSIAAIATIVAILFMVTHFDMTADTDALISPHVAWRVSEERMDAAFPQNSDAILVVVDAATAELAETAASALTARLADDHIHFKRVSRPDGGDFFARNGLLFGSLADVSTTTAHMIDAQPILGPLASDPSLHGIADGFGTIVQGVARGETPLSRIDRPLAALADAIDAQAAGNATFFSWQAQFAGADKHGQPPLRRLILIRPILNYADLEPGAAASGAIRAAAAALALDPAHGVSVRLTGSAPLSDEEFASVVDKAWLIGIAMLLAMIATLWVAMRSGRIVAAVMVTTLAGLCVTTALGLLAVGRFNLISVAFIPLFVGLGVDFGIQIGVRFQSERHNHRTPIHAIEAAASALGPALLLAAGAICLGFLAFLPTAYVGITELGIIAAMGMVVALLFSVTVLPALLILSRPTHPRPETAMPMLVSLDHFLLRRRKLVLGCFCVSLVISIALLPFVRFDFNPLHLPSPNGEAISTLTDLMHDPDRSPNTVDILMPDLATARQMGARLSTIPEVGRAMTIESFVPAQQTEKLAAIADAQMLLDLTLNPIMPAPAPDDAQTIASLRTTAADLRTAAAKSGGPAAMHARRLADSFERLAVASPETRRSVEAMLVAPLNVALDQMRQSLMATPITKTDLPAETQADWIAPDGQALLQLLPREGDDNAALARFARAARAIAPDATGVAVSTQEAAHTVAIAFIQAGLLALALVSLLLLMVLRSLREVALTLAPVLLSGFLTLGTCVLIGQPLNFANIIAFPLLFGVGVAFHIYFVMAWRDGATDLLQSSLARAVFFSALATGTAFGCLWLSSHPGTASMGKILMIALGWTLICALIFEPALLGSPDTSAKLKRLARLQPAI